VPLTRPDIKLVHQDFKLQSFWQKCISQEY